MCTLMDHLPVFEKNNPGLCKKHADEVVMARKYFHSSSSFTLTVMFCELSAAKVVLFYLVSLEPGILWVYIFKRQKKSRELLKIWGFSPHNR